MVSSEGRPVVLGAAGFVSERGLAICRDCAADASLLESHRVGRLITQIVHPAPNGVYQSRKECERYDEPCWICGWPCRRSLGESDGARCAENESGGKARGGELRARGLLGVYAESAQKRAS